MRLLILFSSITFLSTLSIIAFADEATCIKSCDRYYKQCIEKRKNLRDNEEPFYCAHQLGECYFVCKENNKRNSDMP